MAIKKFVYDKLDINYSLTDLPDGYKFNCIDLMKFICAFLVCIIHIKPFAPDYFIHADSLNFFLKNYFCRIAVPFYFMTSGFLLFRKTGFEDFGIYKVKPYCLKLLRMIGVWTVILFVGYTDHLWYLISLVVSIVILGYLLDKKISIKNIVICCFILYIIGLFGDSYYGFILPLKNITLFRIIISGYDTIFQTTRNSIFFGLIFVLMGAIMANKKINMSFRVAAIGFFVSMILLFAEFYLLKHYSNPKDYNMFLFLLPASFFLFYIASHIKLLNSVVYKKIRIVGVLIYFLHPFVNFFVVLGIKFLKHRIGLNFSFLEFIISIILVIVVSIIIERLSKLEKFKWLRYLYS